MTKDDFIKLMAADLPEPPQYFSMDAQLNREGAPALNDLPAPAAEEVNKQTQKGTLVLDVREGADFGAGHVPGSINLGLKGQLASWVGSLISPEHKVIIVAEGEEGVSEAVMRMARVGLENVVAILMLASRPGRAGLELATLPQIPIDELRTRIDEQGDLQIVDVRRPTEYVTGHIPGAVNAELAHLEEKAAELDPSRQTVVACAGGYRSSAAASILERRGFRNLLNVVGGTGAWISGGHPLVASGAAKDDES